MRFLLALFLCLVGCAASTPPLYSGVYHHGDCVAVWQANEFPLEVVVDRRFSPERQLALQEAVTEWNTAVGTPVFTITREIDWYDTEIFARREHTIYVVLNDLPNTWLGVCSLEWSDCRSHNALIGFDVASPDWGATLIFEHELGHALGLMHDDHWTPSIMYPYVLESGGRILDDDLNYVRWETTHGYQADPTVSESIAGSGG